MKIFDFLAMGFSLGLAINLVIISSLALFNGGEVLVKVNQFGEMGIETVLFPIFIVMVLITFIRMGLRIKEGK